MAGKEQNEMPNRAPLEGDILGYIQSMFPNRVLLSVTETAQVLGVAPQTIYNQIAPKSKKAFPVKVVRMNGPKFRVHDIAAHVARM